MAKKYGDRDGGGYRSDGVDLLELGPEDGQELLEFERSAFLLLEADGLDFHLVDAEPRESGTDLVREVDEQIRAGVFAWAAQRNSAVQVPSVTQPNRTVLLHALATRSRVIGGRGG